MILIFPVVALISTLAQGIAAPTAQARVFRSTDGQYSFLLSLPDAIESFEGDEAVRRYHIWDKDGPLIVWFQPFPGIDTKGVVDLITQRRSPNEFQFAHGQKPSRKSVRLGDLKGVRLMDSSGRYQIYVVESGQGAWAIATWSAGRCTEERRLRYVHALSSQISPH